MCVSEFRETQAYNRRTGYQPYYIEHDLICKSKSLLGLKNIDDCLIQTVGMPVDDDCQCVL